MGQSTVATFPAGKSSFIAEYNNAIDAATCGDLIAHLSEDFQYVFEPGPTIGGVNSNIKRSMDTSFMDPDVYNPETMPHLHVYNSLNSIIHSAVWSCLSNYIQEFPTLWSAPNISTTGYRIQRYYRNDGFYREHCDGLPWDTNIDRQNGKTRVLAIIVYLNTVFDGGETLFPLHEYAAKAEVGKVVIFPTTWTHPHIGAVPHSNDKWIISSFVLTEQFSDETSSEVVNEIP